MSEPGSKAAVHATRQVWSVSRLNYEARALLDSAFGTLWVEGEVSNLATPRSGHIYFTLKDSSCQVRCAMFRSQNRHLRFTPANGQQVVLRARVGLYAERGDYQLIAEYMEEAGAGALRRAFDALKARLDAEGLFAEARKKALPKVPGTIGVITSPTGAAIRDFLVTLGKRFPGLPVIIYPVPVQGAEAAPAIANMLATADARGECDVLVLVRGGGSLEDLWAFNDERTARAIAACSLPVVTGIGHEIDFSIADFAADVRAATPTAAAQLVTVDAQAMAERVRSLVTRLGHAAGAGIERKSKTLLVARTQLLNLHPRARLRDHAQRCDTLWLRLRQAADGLLGRARMRYTLTASHLERFRPYSRVAGARALHHQLHSRLGNAMAASLAAMQARRERATRTLATVGPQATLARGYAILTDAEGTRILTDAAQSTPGDSVKARLHRGQLTLKVLESKTGH